MSIKIELNKKILTESAPLKMHFLPAKIDGDGEANVDKYFEKHTETGVDGFLTNSLRGFPLVGEELSVPEPYKKGFVLQETASPLDKDAERTLRLCGSFEKFTYWNYDKVPSKGDPFKQAMQIRLLAEELAKPVTEADVEEEMKRHRSQQKATS